MYLFNVAFNDIDDNTSIELGHFRFQMTATLKMDLLFEKTWGTSGYHTVINVKVKKKSEK